MADIENKMNVVDVDIEKEMKKSKSQILGKENEATKS